MTRSTAISALSALAFAVLYLAATIFPELPEGAYTDAKVLGLIENAGSRNMIIIGSLLYIAAGLALLPFVAQLTGALRGTDPDSPGVGVTFGAGLLYIVMLLMAGNLFGAYASGVAIGEIPMPEEATLVRVLNDLGFGTLLMPGLLSAGVMILASSLLARRSQALPRWVCIAGFVFAPLLLLGAAWVPQFLVPLWTIMAGFSLRRQSVAEPTTAHAMA